MPIQVACQCGQTMTVDDQYAGHLVSCIQCGQQVLVPAPMAQAPMAQAPGAQAPMAMSPGAMAPRPASPAELASTLASPPELASTLAAPSSTFDAQVQAQAPAQARAQAPAQAHDQAQSPIQPQAQAPAGTPAAAPRQKSGNRRRTFVADWAQGMAEQWADDHAESIATDDKPSTAMCFVAGLATIVIGAFSTYVFSMLLLGSLAAQALDPKPMTEGWIGIVVVAILVVLALWTLVSGSTCMARRRGGASAAIPLNLVWSFFSLFTMFQVEVKAVRTDFWLYTGGIVGLCLLGTVLALTARSQAGRYQLWLVRKQQEADGTLNP